MAVIPLFQVSCIKYQRVIAETETQANAEAQKEFHLGEFTEVKGELISNRKYCSGKVMIRPINRSKEGGTPSSIEGGGNR